MSAIIRVENLGKKYVIRHKTGERYVALRDVLGNAAKNIGRRVLSVGKNPDARIKRREDFWALRDINFEVNAGERIGIIGRNGAGKSTLLKILSRITEPTTGRALIKGRIASLLEVGTGFHPELTGRENVYLNGAILGMKKNEIKRKFDDIIGFSEVEKFLDTPVKRFSSGMYVRLAFAIAAHLDSDILVVDEVLAVGDSQFQTKCLNKMETISSQGGRTVLFVSHNLGAISALCPRCIFLERGGIKAFDQTTKIISEYNNVLLNQLTVSITPNMRNRGTGAIQLQACSIMGMSNDRKSAFLIGENIRLEIQLTSQMKGEIAFWLIIFDSSGKPLLSTHQRDSGFIMINEGHHMLTYTTDSLGLMPGDYSISVGAFDRTMTFLEWIDGCQSFQVLPSFQNGVAYDGRWGEMNQPASWDLRSPRE